MNENFSDNNLPNENLPEELLEVPQSQWDTKKIIIIVGAFVGTVTLTLIAASIFFGSSKKTETPTETSVKTSTEVPVDSGSRADSTDTGLTQTQKVSTTSSPMTDGVLKIAVPVGKTVFSELPSNFSKVEKNKLLLVEIDPNLSNFSSTQLALEASLGNLPLEVTKGLEKIEMYIYKGSNDYGPSEAILLKNNLTAEENWVLAKRWELSMVNDWKNFVLIGEKFDVIISSGKKEFTSGLNGKVRYINFTADSAVSLDYSAGKGFLLFANSYSITKRILNDIAF